MRLPDSPGALVWDLEPHARRGQTDWPEYTLTCGIAVAAVYEVGTPHWTFYTDSDEEPYGVGALSRRLMNAHLTVGYNSLEFDHRVVGGMVPGHVVGHELDLYRNVVVPAIGKSPGYWHVGDWTLDAVSLRMFGIGKLRDSASAPLLSRTSRYGELFSYCTRDVVLTTLLYEHLRDHGTLLDPECCIVEAGEVMQRAVDRATNRQTVAT